MKVDLIKKYKWYIFGAIAVVLIMSIGLSFCTWDDNSFKKASMAGGTNDYYKQYAFDDKNNNGNLDNGDIITNFGEFDLIVISNNADSYLVFTVCPVGFDVFSYANNNDYMVSDIRQKLNTTYLSRYSGIDHNIKPSASLEGNKLFLLSIEEVTSDYFEVVQNRASIPCEHTPYGWTFLRDKAKNTGYPNNVATLEFDGVISLYAPEDDLPMSNWPIRYGMWLYK